VRVGLGGVWAKLRYIEIGIREVGWGRAWERFLDSSFEVGIGALGYD